MKQQLVDHLVDSGLVERKDIQTCVLRASLEEGNSVVDEIIDRLDVDQDRLAAEMANFWGLEVWDESSQGIDPEVLEFIPEGLARKFGVIPLANDPREGFKIAVYDVEKARPVIEKIRDKTGAAPSLYLTGRASLESKVGDHYEDDESTGEQKPAAPGQGIVRQKRRSRPDRTTARTNPSGDGEDAKTASSTDSASAGSGRQPEASAGPTRQVDVTADNPFMDLVDEEEQQAENTQSSKDAETEEERPTRAMQAEGEELFAEMTGQDDSETKQAESSGPDEPPPDPFGSSESADESGEPVEEPEPTADEPDEPTDEDHSGSEQIDDRQMDELAGALEQFDAELEEEDDDEIEEADPGELAAESSAVDWGQYRDSDQGAFPGLDAESSSGATPGPETATPDPPARNESGASGVFPVEQSEEAGSDDFFDFEETDQQQQELTLAEVVDRQRQIIDKLEREIEYQKGILQTMAELLVEARVLSKKKLKKRLREFKEQQRNKE